MAVPKQKQSSARRDKRRAQHKIEAPNYNHCPQCHAPRLPHRVCPECGYYARRQVVEPDGSLSGEDQSPQSR
jgi:large subunit ribosomal protein L32